MKTILYILFGGALLLGILIFQQDAQNRIDVKYDTCVMQWNTDQPTLGLSAETFPEKQLNCMKTIEIINTK